MRLINEAKMEIMSKSSNEAFARVTAATFASQADPTLEVIADIKTAVSEAVTNAIIHGYENGRGIIYIELRLYEGKFEVVIKDEGKGIEDVNRAREPLFTTKPDVERSGMGFTLMETLMDELYIQSEPNKGTEIKMIKYL